MHTGTPQDDASLTKEFQKHLTNKHRKNGVIDQGKPKKRFMERKWTDRQYHVQDNADVEHKYVKMYCNRNQFQELSFCGPYSKPHGARGLSNNYNFLFDPKLGMGLCKILRITCACVACTLMLYKPWISGIPSYEQ